MQNKELLENGEKNKDSYNLSILKSDKCEVKFMLECSIDSLPPSCHILDNLNTTSCFQLLTVVFNQENVPRLIE